MGATDVCFSAYQTPTKAMLEVASAFDDLGSVDLFGDQDFVLEQLMTMGMDRTLANKVATDIKFLFESYGEQSAAGGAAPSDQERGEYALSFLDDVVLAVYRDYEACEKGDLGGPCQWSATGVCGSNHAL